MLPSNHPMITHENWDQFTDTDHQTWKQLYERQSRLLRDRAAPEMLHGIETLAICSHQIPKFSELNAILMKNTGFSLVPVKGFIPEALFFQFLSERKFPSTCFIRKPHQLDYLEEPDIFHDIFGHVPLLANPIFADFMEAFGKKGCEAIDRGLLPLLATLYWFTVEFGLINTTAGLRIYGAGIASSAGESLYSLESDIPARIHFNLWRTMKTTYHIDSFQRTYFVIDSLSDLFNAIDQLDWDVLRCLHTAFPSIDQGVIMNDSERI